MTAPPEERLVCETCLNVPPEERLLCETCLKRWGALPRGGAVYVYELIVYHRALIARLRAENERLRKERNRFAEHLLDDWYTILPCAVCADARRAVELKKGRP